MPPRRPATPGRTTSTARGSVDSVFTRSRRETAGVAAQPSPFSAPALDALKANGDALVYEPFDGIKIFVMNIEAASGKQLFFSDKFTKT